MSGSTRGAPPGGGAGRRRAPTFDLARTRGARPRGHAPDLRRRGSARLAARGELDGPVPVLHLLGRQAGQLGADPRRDARGHRRAGGPGFRPFVVVGSALWSFVISGIAGLAWAILEDRERYRVLKYVYVTPSSFLVVLVGRGVARLGVGLAGVVITLVVGVVALGVPFDAGGRRLAAAPGRRSSSASPRSSPSAPAWPASASRPARSRGAIRRRSRGRSSSSPVRSFRSRSSRSRSRLVGLLTPLTWWIAGIREALFPGGPDSIGGPGSLFEALSGHANPTAPRSSSPCWRPGPWLHSRHWPSSESAIGGPSGPACTIGRPGPDLPVPAAAHREGDPMRIYEGSPSARTSRTSCAPWAPTSTSAG